MKSRKYATRFLLIMTGILGFAAAQKTIYAGDLADCVMNLDIARGCFVGDTTTLKGVLVQQFQGHDVQCLIERNPGTARLFVSAFTTGVLKDNRNRNRTCNITITGTGSCNQSVTELALSRKDYAAWALLARAECKAAL